MLMNILLLAHAGEDHSDTAEAFAHFAPWYIAVPVFLVVMTMITYLVWLVTGRKNDTTLLIVSGILLVVGFTMFNISPYISIIAITVGLLATLFSAFVGLTHDSKQDKK